MKKILLIFLLLLSILNVTDRAQKKGTLRGYVTDEETGEALAFCNAYLKGLKIGTTSDANGYFIITGLKSGRTYHLIVSYMGYEPKEYDVKIFPNKVTHLDIKLQKSTLTIGTVEKIGNKVEEPNATNIGIRKISAKELELFPRSVETDVLRSLQYLAGVKTTGDVSARYYVRGGNSDQNMILIEGKNLYNPFHAMGLFSVIDPTIIQGIEFYKAGFPPKFSGRLSSVLDISTREGNKNRFSGRLEASYLSGKIGIEGPIPNGSFIFSGRKSYSTKILDKFLTNNNSPLEFYDYYFKANTELGMGSKLVFDYFSSRDELKASESLTENYDWKNDIWGLKWFMVSEDTPLFFSIAITNSIYKANVLPINNSNNFQKNRVNDFQINADYNYVYTSKDQLNIGLKINDIETNLYIEDQDANQLDIGNKGTSFKLYGNYSFLRYENLGFDVGTNINLTFLGDIPGKLFEPRLKFTYRFSPALALKLSWGIFQQDIATMTNENDLISIFEPWLIFPNYLNTSYSYIYSSGIDYYLAENFKIKTEFYYKTQKNVPAYNDKKVFFDDPDFLNSEVESYGTEVSSDYQNDLFNLKLNYTLSWAYKTLNEFRYLPNFDSKHSLNITLNINLGYGFDLTTIWVYNTGRPFTEMKGYYNKLTFDQFFYNDDYYKDVKPNIILGSKNLRRLPEYHRMDISLSKKFKIGFVSGEASFSVINLYDRKNIFYFDRETGKRINMLPALPTATIKVKL